MKPFATLVTPAASTARRAAGGARRGALLLAALALPGAALAQAVFGPRADYAIGGGPGYPYGVAVGDVNADGRPDIVAGLTSGVAVLLGRAAAPGTFVQATTTYSTSSTPLAVQLGDVNGDGRLDIVTANATAGTLNVLLNSASSPGTFGLYSSYAVGSSARVVALGDVNGDGRPDLASANFDNGVVSVLLNSASTPGTFLPAVAYAGGGSKAGGVAIGDVNGDGRPDLAVANYSNSSVGILLNSAAAPGTFLPTRTYAAGTGIGAFNIVLGDLNGDQRPDIAMPNSATGAVYVLLNAAAAPGTFPTPVTYPGGGTRNVELTMGDVDGDGRLDLAVSNLDNNNVGVLLNAPGAPGTFLPAVTFATGTGSAPRVVVVRDVNADQRPDLVTGNFGNGSVSVFLNAGTYTPLATARATAAPDVALAPNPAHDAFTVTLPANFGAIASAELLDALGRVVRRPAVAGPRFPVQTTGLAPGVYTLRLRTGAATVAKRVTVQ